MKALIFKVLPLVIGVAIGWLLINPPDWLDMPAWVRYPVLLLLVAVVVLIGFMVLILSNLPRDVELKAEDARKVSQGMFDLLDGYERAGFELAGPAFEVGVQPPAILVSLTHTSGEIYGTIFRTQTIPPKTSCDVVSIFEPVGGLTTCAAREGAVLPTGPGVFFQVFENADTQTQLDRHLAALTYLKSRGVRVKHVSADTFPDDFKNAIASQRRFFLRRPFRHTIVTVYRAATGRTPHLGPLEEQDVARRSLDQLNRHVL